MDKTAIPKPRFIKAGQSDVFMDFTCQTCGMEIQHSVSSLFNDGKPICPRCGDNDMTRSNGDVTIEVKNAFFEF